MMKRAIGGRAKIYRRLWPILAIFAAMLLTVICTIPEMTGGMAAAQTRRVTQTRTGPRPSTAAPTVNKASQPTQVAPLDHSYWDIIIGSAPIAQSTNSQRAAVAAPAATPTSPIFFGSSLDNQVRTLDNSTCAATIFATTAANTVETGMAPMAVEPSVLANPAQTTAGLVAEALVEQPTPGTFQFSIVLIDSTGTVTPIATSTTTPASPIRPAGLAFDFNTNPNLFLTGAVGPGTTPRSVFKFTNVNGTITPTLTPIFSESATQDFRPFWVAVRPDTGQVYVTGFHTTTSADDIFVLTPTPGNPGVFTGKSAFATGAHFAATTGRLHGSLAFSKTGTLYVASTDTLGQNGSIEQLNPVAGTNTYSSGTTITTGDLGDIRQIAVEDDGTILVTDSTDPTNTNGAVFKLNPSGAVTSTCSDPGAGGFINAPTGIGAVVTNSCSTTVNALPVNFTSNCTAAGGLPASSTTLNTFFSGVTATSSCGATVGVAFSAPIGTAGAIVDLSTPANRAAATFPQGTTTVTITVTEPSTGATQTFTRTVTVNQAPPTVTINQNLLQTPSLAGMTVGQLLNAVTVVPGPCGPTGTTTVTAFRLVNGQRVPLANTTILPLGQTANIGFTVTIGGNVFNLNPGTQGVPNAITVQFLCADPTDGNQLVVTVPANGVSGTGSYTFTSSGTAIVTNVSALIQLNSQVLRIRTNVPSLNALADGTQGTCQALLFDTTRNRSFTINAVNIRTTP